MRQLIFIAIGFGIQWITSPTFIGMCGASDNPTNCIAIRGGIILVVWIVLNIVAGKK